jgi:hypothetical protein
VNAQSVIATRFILPGVYTPKHLAEKILTSKSALEGERQQVTVLFAYMKCGARLLRGAQDAGVGEKVCRRGSEDRGHSDTAQ